MCTVLVFCVGLGTHWGSSCCYPKVCGCWVLPEEEAVGAGGASMPRQSRVGCSSMPASKGGLN